MTQKLLPLKTSITVRKANSPTAPLAGTIYPGTPYDFYGYVAGWANIKLMDQYPDVGIDPELINGYISPSDQGDKIKIYSEELFVELKKDVMEFFRHNKLHVIFEGHIDPNGIFKPGIHFTPGDKVVVDDGLSSGNVFVKEIVYSHQAGSPIVVMPAFEKNLQEDN